MDILSKYSYNFEHFINTVDLLRFYYIYNTRNLKYYDEN